MSLLFSNSGRRLLLLICAFAGLSIIAGAQSTSDQVWPEVDTFYNFNPKLRLEFMVSRSTDGASYNSIEFGPTLNYFARRFVTPRLTTPNRAKDNLLVLGAGYKYLAGINQEPENRIELDFTTQLPLPGRILLADRNRVDLRFIQASDFTWRYRNSLSAQRTLKIHRFVFSPYAQVEVYYSRSANSWNKTTVQAGVDLPFGKRFDIQPYYERDNNIGSTPRYVNAFGLTAGLHF